MGSSIDELYAYAGLYSQWTDKITGETKDTFAIITTEANPLMEEIYNIKKRMPKLLKTRR